MAKRQNFHIQYREGKELVATVLAHGYKGRIREVKVLEHGNVSLSELTQLLDRVTRGLGMLCVKRLTAAEIEKLVQLRLIEDEDTEAPPF